MKPSGILYDAPQAIWLFAVAILLFWLFWFLFYYRKHYLDILKRSPVLSSLLVPRSSVQFWGTAALYSAAWCCLAYAMMQPKGNGHYPEEAQHKQEQKGKQRRRMHDIAILLDASASMEVKDAPNGRSRFAWAKEIADEMASQLTGESIALYPFTSQVTKLVPATLDYVFFRLMLRQVSINEGDAAGTDFAALLEDPHIQALLSPSTKQKTLVVLSDGGDTRIEDLQGAPREAALQNLSALVSSKIGANVHLFSVGIGSSAGGIVPNVAFQGQQVYSHLQADILQALSSAGKGKYFSTESAAAPQIAKEILQAASAIKPTYGQGSEGITHPQEDLLYDLYYQMPLGAAIIFLLLILLWPPSYSQRSWLIGLLGLLDFCFAPKELTALDTIWLKAQENLEAGNYGQALQTYQNLEDKAASYWEKAVAKYDIGCVYLAEQQWDQALQQFGSLAFDAHLPSLLAKRVWVNIAMARFQQAQQVWQKGNLNKEELKHILFLLRETIGAAKEAQKTSCVLQKAKGLDPCEESANIRRLQSRAYEMLSVVFMQMDQYLLTKSSLAEAVSRFAKAALAQIQQLAMLDKKDLTPDIRKEYVRVFYEEAKSWEPAWQNAKGQISNSGKKIYTEEEQELFLSAESFFIDANEQLRLGDTTRALDAWKKMESTLNQLLKSLWGGNPLKEIAQRLYDSLQLALAENPLQEGTLRSLQSEWAQTSEIKQEKTQAEWKQMLDKTNALIEKSIEALGQTKQLVAKFALTNSMGVLEEFIWELNEMREPEDLLNHVLLAQQNALSLNRLWQQISVSEDQEALLAEQVSAAQKNVLQYANEFLPGVLTAQQKAFRKEGPPVGQPDLRCQSGPWHEVLPLFHQGYISAKQAGDYIQHSPMRTTYTIPLQEAALKAWEQALEKIKQPPSGLESCYEKEGQAATPKQNNQSQTAKPRQSPAAQKEKTPAFDNILQYLQEMDQEDRGKKIPAPIKQGAKPW